MKKENIRFSVLVPVYQAEKHLEECIQSVLKQTYQNWELVLVNDGSTDRSGEICDRYARDNDRIYAYHKENVGTLHTRRVGVEKATGDYYVFLDADDLLKENALEIIQQNIISFGCDCIVYRYESFCEDRIIRKAETEKKQLITDKKELYRKVYLSRGIFAYGMMMLKAVKAEVFGGMDFTPYHHIVLGEDDLQSLEIWGGCKRVVFINDILYRYRMHDDSVMHTITLRRMKDRLIVQRKVFEDIHDREVFDDNALVHFESRWITETCSCLVSACAGEESLAKKIWFLSDNREILTVSLQNMDWADTKYGLSIKTKVVLYLFLKGKYRELIVLSSLYRSFRKKLQ